MKKQINLAIKAHLIRGAFYLFLLFAVCAVPFALAQYRSRGTTMRNTAQQKTGPNDAVPFFAAGRMVTVTPRFSSAAHVRSPVGARTTRLLRSLLPNAVYMIDDGTAEDSVGFGNGTSNFEAVWFNQFDVIPGQTLISTVSVAWGTPLFPDPSINGTPITIGIWADPNGDGNPSDAFLLGQVS